MPRMTRSHFYRHFLPVLLLLWISTTACLSAGSFKVAAFHTDASPFLGEPLIWVAPTTEIMDPLWAKGIVLENGDKRYVLCALDWCGVGGSVYERFRKAIALAAGTDVRQVALHSVHQHAAPYLDGDGSTLLVRSHPKALVAGERWIAHIADRLTQAVQEAASRLQPMNRIGIGRATVKQVASARRILHEGKHLTRWSTGAKDPLLARLPEGDIDTTLQTISLAFNDRVLARLHFYTTHPQTFCCDGRASADFVGAAREAREKEEGIAQIYFTGCSGDVTVGKYNDGQDPARKLLQARLQTAMEESSRSTRWQKIDRIDWQSTSIDLPKRDAAYLEKYRSILEKRTPGSDADAYRAAIAVAFAERKSPLPMSAMWIGNISFLFLPGEPMLAFQRYAYSLRPQKITVVAGYGDVASGYLCTDAAFEEGGYEPSAANAGPGTEARLKEAIQKLLGPSGPAR